MVEELEGAVAVAVAVAPLDSCNSNNGTSV